MTTKKVAIINSLCYYGKSSLTVSLPILATAQIQTAVMPTFMYSSNSDIRTGTFRNLSDDIIPAAQDLNSQNTVFDAILTGCFADEEQIFTVLNACKLLSNTDTQIIVDPIMGDNGKLYPRFSCNFPNRMLELCQNADIIMPNITEACLLTGLPYEDEYDEEYILNLTKTLYEITGAKVVLTGISFDERKIGVAVYANDSVKYVFCNKVPAHYKGSGDIFSAAFVASLVNDRSVSAAAEIAQNYICGSIKQSFDEGIPEDDGIDFESQLQNLRKYLDL